jgi:putative glycosyltransferase (TIGR04348 family)
MKDKPTLCLVTPALAAANNGNWQTASRWARMLAADYRVRLVAQWDGGDDAAMIALHARRSAASIAGFATVHPGRPRVVVLTGTDLYRDILVDAAAQRSLALAHRLVVLHELAPQDVPAQHRAKCVVCFQSTTSRRLLRKSDRHLRALMVGHLRDEKMPQTLFDAVRLLKAGPGILVDHIGDDLDPALGAQARALAAECPAYRWLGARPHRETRDRIQRAHVLVHCSRMEGGAHVVMEAMCSGTPVLASRVAGNLGLLGSGYGGTFEPGDAPALATLLERARDDPAMLPALRLQCAERAPLFEPAHERTALRALMSHLMSQAHDELLETPR